MSTIKLKYSNIQEWATKCVDSMGDIFFNPQAGFGEYSIPCNIAINRVAAELDDLAQSLGAEVDYDTEDLPESSEGEAGPT